VHGLLLVGLGAFGRTALVGAAGGPPPEAALVALTPIVLPIEVATPQQELAAALIDEAPAVDRPLDAPAGERDNPADHTRAPAEGDGREHAAPAPDRGAAGGAPLAHAYRRDTSVLHARLTDGAAENQASHLRTSRHRSSPQARRREPRVGIGDSIETETPTRAPVSVSQTEAAVPAEGGEPAGAGASAASSASQATPSTAPLADKESPAHTVGPLDAEAGARRFDVQRPGAAADDQTQRTASTEMHPGITDFSRPSAPAVAAAPTGKGPSQAPGAVARATLGTAPAELGAPSPQEESSVIDERTQDRRYQRYYQEILQRVARVREFPKSLALRLEQGETIVQFVVGVDGRLRDGPRVVKSSGFSEFDSEAVRAVKRAAPFPPLPVPANARPVPVSLRQIFDNPVIR
jgi:TonB family protein